MFQFQVHQFQDLDECAAADSAKVCGGGSHGETGIYHRILRILNCPVAVPPRRFLDSLRQSPKITPGSEQLPHLQTPSQYKEKQNIFDKENLQVLPKEPKQHHPSHFAASRIRNRAGWASKERSTPEDINMEQHAWRFQFSFPRPGVESHSSSSFFERDSSSSLDSEPPVVMRKKKPPEVRNALREKRIAQRQRVSQRHAEVALRKYNRANNTQFELVEVRETCLFFEFGGACYHYNFTAKPEGHHSADGSVKLFFSEVNGWVQSENDILLCCIVGEDDAGHCYGCEDYRPVVHPSSHAYGGGNSTCIELPGSDGSSTDSD